jgi:hypothetical protein
MKGSECTFQEIINWTQPWSQGYNSTEVHNSTGPPEHLTGEVIILLSHEGYGGGWPSDGGPGEECPRRREWPCT